MGHHTLAFPMSLLIAFFGYICLAVVNILDKFILSKAVPKPIMFVFYSTALVLPIFVLLLFGAGYLADFIDYIIAAIAGICFSLALWAMYIGWQQSEVSHAGPLLGAVTSFFVLFLGQLFLLESLTAQQIMGVFILIVGSLLISGEKSRQHQGWHIGMLWIILAGLLYAISHVASKYTYDAYGFYTGLVWTRGFMGLFGAALLLSPTVRRTFFGAKPSRADQTPMARQFGLVFSSRALAVVAVLLLQYAIAIGSVTIVNALAGIQFAFLLAAIVLLTKFAPRLFREKFVSGELKSEFLAVVVIALGLVLVIV